MLGILLGYNTLAGIPTAGVAPDYSQASPPQTGVAIVLMVLCARGMFR